MSKKFQVEGFSDQQKSQLQSALSLAKQCTYEAKHTKQVTRLALEIFDQLQPLHHMEPEERFYLLCASLLHDIGVHTEGPKKHHKTALKIILDTPILEFSNSERLIIGSIARYHRRALPSKRHDHFAALSPQQRLTVSKLSAILRVADGLDYSHKSRVKGIQITLSKNKIIFTCLVRKRPIKKEINSAEKKSYLLSMLYNREVEFLTQEGEEFVGWS